jgi:maltooligosyltrehalose synthase
VSGDRRRAAEARLRTSWRRAGAGDEAASTRQLASMYADRELLDELAAQLAAHGDRNSLAQLRRKLTAPGTAA